VVVRRAFRPDAATGAAVQVPLAVGTASFYFFKNPLQDALFGFPDAMLFLIVDIAQWKFLFVSLNALRQLIVELSSPLGFAEGHRRVARGEGDATVGTAIATAIAAAFLVVISQHGGVHHHYFNLLYFGFPLHNKTLMA
jgi:hypothetical protein